MFHYLPLLGNVIAFKDYQPYLGISGSDWVGLDNFSILFNGDPAFLQRAEEHPDHLTVHPDGLRLPGADRAGAAAELAAVRALKRIVQSILYLPHFMSWVIVVALFQQMLGDSGLLNNYPASSTTWASLQHHRQPRDCSKS